MKLRSRRGLLKVNKIFTDRNEARELFWNNYHYFKDELQSQGELKVLAYYGIGGIGKSSLLKNLQEELINKVEKPRFVYFDFDLAQDSRAIMEYMRHKLSTEYGFKFHLFDLGIYAYARKIGEDTNAPEIQGLIDKSQLLACVVETVGAIPIAGMGVQLLKAADKGVAFLRNLIQEHDNELKGIENKTPAQLYEYLPFLFAQDLAANLKNSFEPLVVFLDTYERLVNEMSSVGEPLNNDLWLRGIDGLVQNTPNTLWVIAGRESLKWVDFDAEWATSLEQHNIENLSRTDADNFMRCAGITNAELRNDLYDLTSGTPAYLDLCVDRHTLLVERGQVPKITDFGTDRYVLIERFVRYMDDSRKDIVYMLSCLRRWDDFMIAEIAPKILSTYSHTTYEKVKNFSFIKKSNKYSYNIYQTVGEVLLDKCPLVIKNAVIQQAVKYSKELLDSRGVFDPVYPYTLQWLLKFGIMHFPEEDNLTQFYKENLREYFKRLSVSGQGALTDWIFETFIQVANKHKDSLLYALALNEESFWKHKTGEYAKAVALAKEAVAIYEKKTGVDSELTLKAKHRLGERLRANGQYKEAYEILSQVLKQRELSGYPTDVEELDIRDDIADVLHLLGRYKEALPLIQETLKLRESIQTEETAASYNTLWNLGVVMDQLGNYKEAEAIKRKLYDKSLELLGEKHIGSVNALSSLGYTVANIGNYKAALPIRRKVLELRREILGEKHPSTINAMHHCAETLRDLGKYGDALPLSKQVLALRQENLGEKHPDTVKAMSNYGVTLTKLGQHNEALGIRNQILALRMELLGPKHPDTLTTMNNVALSLRNLGRFKEALPISKQVLELRQEVLGEEHPATIRAMSSVAITLRELGRYYEALPLSRKVLELRQKVLGEKHPETILAMTNLVLTLRVLGRFSEALPINQAEIELIKEVLGEDHPDVMAAKHSLAMIMRGLGQHEASLPLIQEVLEHRKNYFGEKHPDTITAMSTLAINLRNLGNYKEALPINRNVLALRKEVLGDKHPLTLTAMSNLGITLCGLGEYAEDLQLSREVLGLRSEALGDKHPDTIEAMCGLAITLNSLGEFEEALSIRKNILALRKEILGEEHQKTIGAMNGLAWQYYLTNDPQKGIPLAENVIEYDVQSQDIGLTKKIVHKDTLVMLYSTTGRHEEAIAMARELVELVQQRFPDRYDLLAQRLGTLAYCLYNANQVAEAMALCEQSCKLYDKTGVAPAKESVNPFNLRRLILCKL